MARAQIVTKFPTPAAPPRRAEDGAPPLLLLGPSVRLGDMRAEMLLLTPSNRVSEPEDPFRPIPMLDDAETAIGLATSGDISKLAQAEQDGRDAAYLSDFIDPRIAALTGDLLGGIDGLFTPPPMMEGRDGVLVLTQRADEDRGKSDTNTARTVEAETDAATRVVPLAKVDRLRRAVAAAEVAKADLAAPLLLEQSDRVATDAPCDDGMRRMVTRILRQELSGELGARIARDVRNLVLEDLRQANAPDQAG